MSDGQLLLEKGNSEEISMEISIISSFSSRERKLGDWYSTNPFVNQRMRASIRLGSIKNLGSSTGPIKPASVANPQVGSTE